MTVEELRDRVLQYTMGRCVDHDHYIVDGFAVRDICVVHTADLDSLITAAEFLGMKKRKELDAAYAKIGREEYEQAKKIELAKARAEGAEQMKQQIRDSVSVGYSILTAPVPPIKYVMVPASVLAPSVEGKK